jgi:hypothetical protein
MIKLPQLNVVRIPLGMFLVLIGTAIASIAHIVPYFIGAIIATIGAWIFSKHLNKYFRGGLAWVIVGLPMFLFSLMPNSFDWMSDFGMTNMTITVTRFIGVFLGAITFLMVYETD